MVMIKIRFTYILKIFSVQSGAHLVCSKIMHLLLTFDVFLCEKYDFVWTEKYLPWKERHVRHAHMGEMNDFYDRKMVYMVPHIYKFEIKVKMDFVDGICELDDFAEISRKSHGGFRWN